MFTSGNCQNRMREPKMAELQFEAPLAAFDGEEWNDFNDYETSEDLTNFNAKTDMSNKTQNTPEVDNFSETFSGSLEDLVNTFDDKIKHCFKDYGDKVESFAPVQVRTQEEIMSDCQMWWTITGNFGNVLPIDWSKTYARELQEKSLNLDEKKEVREPELDLSEDEELREAFDIHSMIISSLQHEHEPIVTAEEVISEIDSMMEDESEMSLDGTSLTPSSEMYSSTCSAELLQFRERYNLDSTNLEETSELPEGLKSLSMSALNELLEEIEATTKDYSATLVHELALREDLDYEKELKNQFISLLMNIQQKKRDLATARKKSPSPMSSMTSVLSAKVSGNNGTAPGTYLTTVIPYHTNQGPPTIEQLQVYIKILEAINEDSAAVPALLTDYILKVLCPTN